jgi:hypothetical protein
MCNKKKGGFAHYIWKITFNKYKAELCSIEFLGRLGHSFADVVVCSLLGVHFNRQFYCPSRVEIYGITSEVSTKHNSRRGRNIDISVASSTLQNIRSNRKE